MALWAAAEAGASGKRANAQADRELAAAAAAGDPDARRRLAERLMDRVRATAAYLAAGHPDAEDYAQLALVEILESAGSFRGASALESWADRIAVRTVMRYVKQRRWRAQHLSFDSEQEAVSAADTEREVGRRRLARRLAELFAKLKPKQREVVTMRVVLGYSLREIAEATGANVNTVRYRLDTGRNKLRRQLRRDPALREWLDERR